jgi:hypothetical protein
LQGIARYTLAVAKPLRLADRPGELIPRSEIEAEADRWVSRPGRPPAIYESRLRLSFMRHAIRWLTFLGRVQPSATVQRPYADHVAEFTEYLRSERGLSPNTIANRGWTVQAFLARIGEALKEIGDHLGHRLPQTTRIYAKVDLAALRIVGDFALEGVLRTSTIWSRTMYTRT